MKALRDTIEHIDDKIAKGDIHRGKWMAPMLSVDGSALEVGKEAILVVDLAAMIRTLWGVASYFSTLGCERGPK